MTKKLKRCISVILLFSMVLFLTGCVDKKNITIKNTTGKIEDQAYTNNHDIETVVIENGVTEIGEYAFDQCINLSAISLPDSLEAIGKCAFRNSSIETIVFPSGIKSIGDSAFEGSRLKSVTVPASVTQSYQAFSGCKLLTEVTLQEGLEKIGGYCFAGCDQLASLEIPDSVKVIEDNAFRYTALLSRAGDYLPLRYEDLDSMIAGAADARSDHDSIAIEGNAQIMPLQYLEDFKGNLYLDLAGDLYCQMPRNVRTLDVNEADYILFVLFSESHSSNYIGPAYDKITSVYLWKKDNSLSLLFTASNKPTTGTTILAPGIKQVTGEKATGEEIWNAIKDVIR